MSIAQLIGNTPVLEYAPHRFAKLEGFNPAGSSKDRVARSILLGAEKEGRLQPGGAIVEPTSGNTGIALAAIGAARGYRVILTMPDTMSVERQNLIRAYGGEVVLTPGEAGMQGAIDRAQALLGEIPGAILAGQFDNPLNPQAHFETTGPELARQIGDIAALVACVGTGGTLTGTARYLKTLYPHSARRGGGARRFARALGRQERSAQNPGHRRGLCAQNARSVPRGSNPHRDRRGSIRSRARLPPRDGAAGGHFFGRGAFRRRARGGGGQHRRHPAGQRRAVSFRTRPMAIKGA